MKLSTCSTHKLSPKMSWVLLLIFSSLMTTCGEKQSTSQEKSDTNAATTTPDPEAWTTPVGGETPDGKFEVIELGEKREIAQNSSSAIKLELRGGLFKDAAWVFYECSSRQVGSTIDTANCGGNALKDLDFGFVADNGTFNLTMTLQDIVSSAKPATIEALIAPGEVVKFGSINSGRNSRNGGVVVKLAISKEISRVASVVKRRDSTAAISTLLMLPKNSSSNSPNKPTGSNSDTPNPASTPTNETPTTNPPSGDPSDKNNGAISFDDPKKALEKIAELLTTNMIGPSDVPVPEKPQILLPPVTDEVTVDEGPGDVIELSPGPGLFETIEPSARKIRGFSEMKSLCNPGSGCEGCLNAESSSACFLDALFQITHQHGSPLVTNEIVFGEGSTLSLAEKLSDLSAVAKKSEPTFRCNRELRNDYLETLNIIKNLSEIPDDLFKEESGVEKYETHHVARVLKAFGYEEDDAKLFIGCSSNGQWNDLPQAPGKSCMLARLAVKTGQSAAQQEKPLEALPFQPDTFTITACENRKSELNTVRKDADKLVSILSTIQKTTQDKKDLCQTNFNSSYEKILTTISRIEATPEFLLVYQTGQDNDLSDAFKKLGVSPAQSTLEYIKACATPNPLPSWWPSERVHYWYSRPKELRGKECAAVRLAYATGQSSEKPDNESGSLKKSITACHEMTALGAALERVESDFAAINRKNEELIETHKAAYLSAYVNATEALSKIKSFDEGFWESEKDFTPPHFQNPWYKRDRVDHKLGVIGVSIEDSTKAYLSGCPNPEGRIANWWSQRQNSPDSKECLEAHLASVTGQQSEKPANTLASSDLKDGLVMVDTISRMKTLTTRADKFKDAVDTIIAANTNKLASCNSSFASIYSEAKQTIEGVPATPASLTNFNIVQMQQKAREFGVTLSLKSAEFIISCPGIPENRPIWWPAGNWYTPETPRRGKECMSALLAAYTRQSSAVPGELLSMSHLGITNCQKVRELNTFAATASAEYEALNIKNTELLNKHKEAYVTAYTEAISSLSSIKTLTPGFWETEKDFTPSHFQYDWHKPDRINHKLGVLGVSVDTSSKTYFSTCPSPEGFVASWWNQRKNSADGKSCLQAQLASVTGQPTEVPIQTLKSEDVKDAIIIEETITRIKAITERSNQFKSALDRVLAASDAQIAACNSSFISIYASTKQQIETVQQTPASLVNLNVTQLQDKAKELGVTLSPKSAEFIISCPGIPDNRPSWWPAGGWWAPETPRRGKECMSRLLSAYTRQPTAIPGELISVSDLGILNCQRVKELGMFAAAAASEYEAINTKNTELLVKHKDNYVEAYSAAITAIGEITTLPDGFWETEADFMPEYFQQAWYKANRIDHKLGVLGITIDASSKSYLTGCPNPEGALASWWHQRQNSPDGKSCLQAQLASVTSQGSEIPIQSVNPDTLNDGLVMENVITNVKKVTERARPFKIAIDRIVLANEQKMAECNSSFDSIYLSAKDKVERMPATPASLANMDINSIQAKVKDLGASLSPKSAEFLVSCPGIPDRRPSWWPAGNWWAPEVPRRGKECMASLLSAYTRQSSATPGELKSTKDLGITNCQKVKELDTYLATATSDYQSINDKNSELLATYKSAYLAAYTDAISSLSAIKSLPEGFWETEKDFTPGHFQLPWFKASRVDHKLGVLDVSIDDSTKSYINGCPNPEGALASWWNQRKDSPDGKSCLQAQLASITSQTTELPARTLVEADVSDGLFMDQKVNHIKALTERSNKLKDAFDAILSANKEKTVLCSSSFSTIYSGVRSKFEAMPSTPVFLRKYSATKITEKTGELGVSLSSKTLEFLTTCPGAPEATPSWWPESSRLGKECVGALLSAYTRQSTDVPSKLISTSDLGLLNCQKTKELEDIINEISPEIIAINSANAELIAANFNAAVEEYNSVNELIKSIPVIEQSFWETEKENWPWHVQWQPNLQISFKLDALGVSRDEVTNSYITGCPRPDEDTPTWWDTRQNSPNGKLCLAAHLAAQTGQASESPAASLSLKDVNDGLLLKSASTKLGELKIIATSVKTALTDTLALNDSATKECAPNFEKLKQTIEQIPEYSDISAKYKSPELDQFILYVSGKTMSVDVRQVIDGCKQVPEQAPEWWFVPRNWWEWWQPRVSKARNPKECVAGLLAVYNRQGSETPILDFDTKTSSLNQCKNIKNLLAIATDTRDVLLTPANDPAPRQVKGIAGTEKVNLVWSTKFITPADYKVEYSSDNGENWNLFDDGVSDKTFVEVTGLMNNRSYIFRVAAINSDGSVGAFSEPSQTFVPKTEDELSDGSSADKAAPSAALLKLLKPDATDGVYWINLPKSGPTQVYCLMDDKYDGGGWMLALKATRGETFNYDSPFWTTENILNASDVSRSDADAKFPVMNEFAGNDLMALWPDLGSGGDISTIEDTWVWLEKDVLNSRSVTNFFSSSPEVQISRTRGEQWSSKFSSQPGFQFYGLNYKGNSPHYGGSKVRWGFAWNNEGDQNSNDVSGGIGMQMGKYSAGDFIGCCGWAPWVVDNAGFNRSARVEIYVK